MKKISEIVAAMPCLALNKHPCDKCVYNPKPGRTWLYGCVHGQSELVADAIEALNKTQEGTSGQWSVESDQ